ncbi:MAG: acetolactate synthase [Jiangellaceae bacterium]|nr:acetolactate synthase [Jiangellaceae bacterium]
MLRPVRDHAGHQARAVFAGHGIDVMWTLCGAHVFPLYDAAVRGEPAMRIVDVRHEQTAVFGAEATAKLTRTPGLAVLTAGPGVTNGASAIAQSFASGVPVLTVGGRAPSARWGMGALQELDHPPILAPITKRSITARTADQFAAVLDDALRLACTPHRGPVFVDVPIDALFAPADGDGQPTPGGEPSAPNQSGPTTAAGRALGTPPDPDDLTAVAALLAGAHRPVLVLGSDVWLDGAESAALQFAEQTAIPVVANGMGRGVLRRGHPLLVNRARATAFARADLVIIGGTPLDFRLSYGDFGKGTSVVHVVDAPEQLATHVALAGSVAGDLSAAFDGLLAAYQGELRRSSSADWLRVLRTEVARAAADDAAMLSSDAEPIHPARIYGELMRLLDDDAVVIGDGGDFVSWAGRFLDPARPGCWLDPGPFGCLGAGAGAAAAARLARPRSQVVVLYGDGAAGMSLMDVDTLVRHAFPVVLVVGNNGAWGLEKHPMRAVFGYDVAADLRRETAYEGVVQALGGAGEAVDRPDGIEPALRRAFAAGVPYLVNVRCDPRVAYPRSTFGV